MPSDHDRAHAPDPSWKPATLAVWRSTNRKRLAYVKVGGQVRYRRADLDQFISDGLRNAEAA